MHKILLSTLALVILAGCTHEQEVTNVTEQKEPVKQVEVEQEEVKNTLTVEVEESYKGFEIPELGIVLDVPQNVANDLVYEFNAEHDSVGFTTKTLLSYSNHCTPSAIGSLYKVSKSEACFNANPIAEFEEFNVCYIGPHALCATPKQHEQAQNIVPAGTLTGSKIHAL